jgi:hypothetical protein
VIHEEAHRNAVTDGSGFDPELYFSELVKQYRNDSDFNDESNVVAAQKAREILDAYGFDANDPAQLRAFVVLVTPVLMVNELVPTHAARALDVWTLGVIHALHELDEAQGE